MSAFAPIASTSTAGSTSTAAPNGANGTAPSARPDDALLSSLASRLVQSGEWNRILRMLDLRLNASGWDDEVRVHAQGACFETTGDDALLSVAYSASPYLLRPAHTDSERARSQDPLNLSRLVEDITPLARGATALGASAAHSTGSVPATVRDDVVAALRAWVEKVRCGALGQR